MSSKDYNDMEVGSQGSYGQWTQAGHEFQDNPVPPAEYSYLPEVVYDRDTLPEAGLDPRYLQYASDSSRLSQQSKLDGSSVSLGYTQSPPERKSTKETRYYCSTTRRVFWISVLAAALILAAAIAGGVAGGLTRAHHSSLHQSETSQTTLLTTISGIPSSLHQSETTLLTTVNGISEIGKIKSATRTTHGG
jgi:hypothetical protein